MVRSLFRSSLLIFCALSLLNCAGGEDSGVGAGGGLQQGSGGSGSPSGGAGGAGGAATGGGSSNGGTATGGIGGSSNGGSSNGGSSNGGSSGGSDNGGGYTAAGFTNLAPPMGDPLTPENATALTPPALAGWHWYAPEGAVCRDGSPAGFFTKFTESDKLLVYIEGGGACTNLGFCNFNPPNVNKVISGDGQQVIGSAGGLADVRQEPGAFILGKPLQGIWDETQAANPFKGWNMVYIPYCTGDVHFGTRRDVEVPGSPGVKQQFVGYLNMQKFVGRIVPTFKDKISRGIIMGVSAGSFGAALNFSMWQDAFSTVRLDAILDSGPPFKDQWMPACMQKRWREVWGFDKSLPADCTECSKQADGGGLVGLADFLVRKHPKAHLAMISSMEDEVIRLFFSSGVKNCSTYDTADPVAITVGQVLDPTALFSSADYIAGLNDLRASYLSTNRFATYFMGGANTLFHQHTWRPRFYEAASGGKTIAAFVQEFLDGKIEQVGP